MTGQSGWSLDALRARLARLLDDCAAASAESAAARAALRAELDQCRERLRALEARGAMLGLPEAAREHGWITAGLRSPRARWVILDVARYLEASGPYRPVTTREVLDGLCLRHEAQLVARMLNRLMVLGVAEKWDDLGPGRRNPNAWRWTGGPS